MNALQKEILYEFRRILDGHVAMVADSPERINDAMAAIRTWHPGPYAVGNVRSFEGIPYKCVQDHDSTAVPDWDPTVASLWMQYHGTSPETARAWIAPTGAHDQYLAGEYMVYTDGKTYKCLTDTIYSPELYNTAWEVI